MVLTITSDYVTVYPFDYIPRCYIPNYLFHHDNRNNFDPSRIFLNQENIWTADFKISTGCSAGFQELDFRDKRFKYRSFHTFWRAFIILARVPSSNFVNTARSIHRINSPLNHRTEFLPSKRDNRRGGTYYLMTVFVLICQDFTSRLRSFWVNLREKGDRDRERERKIGREIGWDRERGEEKNNKRLQG